MNTHDRYALHCFAHGKYDALFRHYRDYQGEKSEYIHLLSGTEKNPRWVVLKPRSNRAAEVLWSNFLPMGASVRSGIPLKHAARSRQVGSWATVGDPRWLEVLSVPRDRFRLPRRSEVFFARPTRQLRAA